jgi:hypothetical protein
MQVHRMDNGRPAPGSGTSVANTIPMRSPAAARTRYDQPSGRTAVRLTRRGQIVRSAFITILILIIALVAGLFAGGISGLV